MLKTAKLYEERLIPLILEHQYELSQNLACGGTGGNTINFPDSNENEHHFVSVDSDDEILGVCGYYIDWASRVVTAIYIISYSDVPRYQFGKDIIQMIDDIFTKFNLNKIEWTAYSDNKAMRPYRKFCKRYGGREVGTLHQHILLMDGNVHDTTMFELMREDYLGCKEMHKRDRRNHKERGTGNDDSEAQFEYGD